MSDIKITIGADIKELEQKLSVAKTKVEGFDKSSTAAAGSFRKFGDVLPDVGKKASGMSDKLKGAADAAQAAGGDLGDMAGILQGGLIALIPVAVAGLKALYDALFGASEAEKAFNETLEASASAFTKAYAAVSGLNVQAELLSKGIGNQDEFLKNYNETLGKTIGETDNLATAEKNLVKFGDKYIQLMFLKAVANNAFAKSGQLVFESLALQQQGGDIPEWALKIRLKELQEQIQILNNLAVNAQKLAAVVSNDLPQKVGAGLSGLNGGKGFVVDVPIIPKVKIKKQDVEDFKIRYNGFFAELFTSENTQTPIEFKIKLAPVFDDSENEETRKQARDKLIAYRELFAGIASDVFSSIGNAIGKVASGGTLKGFFSSLFQTVGSGLQKLGIFFLTASKLIDRIKKLLAGAPQIAGIAAIGLIALGSVISAVASKNAFATGTRNFSGGSALVGERGPELLTLPSGSSITPNAQLNAMGGREVFIAETVIRGTDLVTVYNRATALNSRNS